MLGEFKPRLLFLCSGGILLAACGATRFHSTWRDRQFAFLGLQKALIVGVVQKQENQRLLEDAFAQVFAPRGVKCITSYSLAQEGGEMTEKDWKRILNDEHVEMIVVSRLVDVEAVEEQVLPNVYAGGSYDYYRRCIERNKRPVDKSKWKFATVETRVYDSVTDNMVWTGDSQTKLDPGVKVDALVREFAERAVNAMYAR